MSCSQGGLLTGMQDQNRSLLFKRGSILREHRVATRFFFHDRSVSYMLNTRQAMKPSRMFWDKHLTTLPAPTKSKSKSMSRAFGQRANKDAGAKKIKTQIAETDNRKTKTGEKKPLDLRRAPCKHTIPGCGPWRPRLLVPLGSPFNTCRANMQRLFPNIGCGMCAPKLQASAFTNTKNPTTSAEDVPDRSNINGNFVVICAGTGGHKYLGRKYAANLSLRRRVEFTHRVNLFLQFFSCQLFTYQQTRLNNITFEIV